MIGYRDQLFKINDTPYKSSNFYVVNLLINIDIDLQINFIPFQYPVVVNILYREMFRPGIKYSSSDLKVSKLDIEIKRSRLTNIPRA